MIQMQANIAIVIIFAVFGAITSLGLVQMRVDPTKAPALKVFLILGIAALIIDFGLGFGESSNYFQWGALVLAALGLLTVLVYHSRPSKQPAEPVTEQSATTS